MDLLKIVFLSISIALLISCDPGPGYIYVRNYTNNDVYVEVEHAVASDFDSIRYVDYVVEDIEDFHVKEEMFKVENYIRIKKINDFKYLFILPKKSTTLLKPIYILIPIEHIIIKFGDKYLEFCFYKGCDRGKYYSLMKGGIFGENGIHGKYPLVIIDIK